jgi:preprotein translocase subunit SecG
VLHRLNSNLRKIIAIAGGLFVILTLIARIEDDKDDNDGFQTREFDDIW